MNQDWYCTSKTNAHIMILFLFHLLRIQGANLVFHQSCSDAIILHNNTPASALDKVVTFASEVLFGRETHTLTKPEATLGDRVGLRISSQHEESYPLNQRQTIVFLIYKASLEVSCQINDDQRFDQ